MGFWGEVGEKCIPLVPAILLDETGFVSSRPLKAHKTQGQAWEVNRQFLKAVCVELHSEEGKHR